MFRLLLDFVSEYLRETEGRKWIGNERLAEMEADFDHVLKQFIDARIKANQP